MKSKTSFFNAGIFKNLLKRFWPLWFAYFAVWFIGLPLVTLVQSNAFSSGAVSADLVCNFEAVIGFCHVSGFIMAIMCAAAVFNFLFNSRSTGMVASMPVGRSAVFCSAYLAGFVPVLTANLLIAVFNALFALGGTGLEASAVIKLNASFFAVNTLDFIVFYGIAVLTAMLTGNNYALPALYVIFNFLFIGMEQIVGLTYGQFIYGYTSDLTSNLEFLSPVIYFFGKIQSVATVNLNLQTGVLAKAVIGWQTLIIYSIVGIVLSVIAMLMYRKRRMEAAGDVIAVKALRPVFKYGVTVCASLCFGLLFYAIVAWNTTGAVFELIILAVGLLIGAFIGYFASQMLLKKSLHVFRGNWLGYVIVAVWCVAFAACCVFDVFGIGTALPDADDVAGASLWDEDYSFKETAEIEKALEINRAIIADRSKYENLDPDDETICWVEFKYTLKDGSEIRRYYEICEDENYADYMALVNSEVAVEAYYSGVYSATIENAAWAWVSYRSDTAEASDFDIGVELTPQQIVDFCKAFIADIDSGVVETGFICDNDLLYTVEIQLEQENEYGEIEPVGYYTVEVSPEYANSVAWFNENIK